MADSSGKSRSVLAPGYGGKISSPCNQMTGTWMRTFDVKEPIRHRKGYTLYKVVSRVYPTIAPEAVTEITVWKRYSDFKKLHADIVTLHKNLHLQGKVPIFAKRKIFGRFEDAVIENRRRSAKELLDFIGLHPPLFTSQLFAQFFEDDASEIRLLDERKTLREKPLIPSPPESESEATASQDGEQFVVISTPETSDEDSPCVPEDQTLSIFLTPPSPEHVRKSAPKPEEPTMRKSSSISSFLGGIWRHFRDDDTISLSSDVSDDALTVSAELARNIAEKCHVVDGSDEKSPSHVFVEKGSQSGRYIVLAAEVVASAQEAESQADFRSAFVKYKASIGILLEGVQNDDDHARRNAVRKKTAKYLERAEAIHRCYLANSEEFTWDDGISPNYCASILHLQVPLIELSRYKILGVIGTVLLALDAVLGRTCVIKVLRKASASGLWTSVGKKTVVPDHVAHVVKLYHFHETPSSIFLVLEYATGGKLWDYLGKYSEMKRKTLRADSLLEGRRNSDFGDQVQTSAARQSLIDGIPVFEESCRTRYEDLFRPETGDEPVVNLNEGPDDGDGVCKGVFPGRPTHRRSKSMDVRIMSPSHRGRLDSRHSFDAGDHSGTSCMGSEQKDEVDWSDIMPESCVKRWGAELVVAVAGLHAAGIVCKDLRPANVLLGSGGQILLSYFSEWCCINRTLLPQLVDSGYMAPEVLAGVLDGCGPKVSPTACDWWSVGVLLYELLTWHKFVDCHVGFSAHQVVLRFPDHLSKDARDLLSELLRFNPKERLGAGVRGWEEIKAHPFFKGTNWDLLLKQADDS